MPKLNGTQKFDALLGSITAGLIGGEQQSIAEHGLRVENLLMEMVRPDPVQPRRVLPETLHHRFHDNRLTPTQSLRELVQRVQVAARQRGRPFTNVLELLPDADTEEGDAEVRLSPEEQLLRDLVHLAVTIRDDGQVNPLTVVDASQGVTRLYRIETGERRYWATWLLRDFIPNYTGNGTIPCIVIPAQRSSVFRQAKENTARSGLTAIAMARQAALLLLTVHGYEIPAYAVNNDFYRQALELDLRGHREHTDAILSAMGGIDKRRFHQYKMLLKLSDDALELADRYAIDEKKLRYVVPLDSDLHTEFVQQIVDLNLTSRQVEEICAAGIDTAESHTDDTVSLPAAALKLARLTLTSQKSTPQDIARALMQQEGDAKIARVRLQGMQKLLADAEEVLTSSIGLPG
jgi:hypothetical protein